MGDLPGKGVAAWLRLACVVVLAAVAGAQEPLQEAFSGAPSAAELRRRLGALPAAELASLFRLAVESRLVLPEADTFLPLDEAQQAAVRAALAARPRSELLPFLEDLARRPLAPRERLECHALLGVAGTAEDLRLLLRLSLAPGEGLPPQELRASFIGALAGILRRSPGALEQAAALFPDCPPGLAGSLIEALAQCEGPRVTEALARFLGRVPGLDGLLLCRLAQRGRFSGHGAEFVFEALRRYFHHADPGLAAAAARAAAALGDDGAVEELIELIEHRDQRVRRGAFEALAQLSGLDHGEDVARWTRWYHAEMLWWEREADANLVRIERAHGPEYVRAAREVLEHRLHRDRSAESFAQALTRRDADEIWLACRALRELRSPAALPALIEVLEHDDPRLRAAAYEALRAITGLELAPEAELWLPLVG